MKTITEDQFLEQYKPVKNQFNDGYGFDGCMFETFGPNLAYVTATAQVSEAFVWTVYDDMSITSGMHFVNRFGYLITELPCDEDFIDVLPDIDLYDHDEEGEEE